MPSKTPTARFRPETPQKRRPDRADVISIGPTVFSHGLQEFRNARIQAENRGVLRRSRLRGEDGSPKHYDEGREAVSFEKSLSFDIGNPRIEPNFIDPGRVSFFLGIGEHFGTDASASSVGGD